MWEGAISSCAAIIAASRRAKGGSRFKDQHLFSFFFSLFVVPAELFAHWLHVMQFSSYIAGMILVETSQHRKRTLEKQKSKNHGVTNSAVGTIVHPFHGPSVHAVMSNIDLPCDSNRLDGCAADPRFLGSWAPR
jgi:hypothetical protein